MIGETVDDDRLARKDKVLGIGHDGGTKTFPLSALETNPVVNDRVAGEDTVVFFQPDTQTVLVCRRTLDGGRSVFGQEVDEYGTVLLRDVRTRSRLLPFTGHGIDGELQGGTTGTGPLRRVVLVRLV